MLSFFLGFLLATAAKSPTSPRQGLDANDAEEAGYTFLDLVWAEYTKTDYTDA